MPKVIVYLLTLLLLGPNIIFPRVILALDSCSQLGISIKPDKNVYSNSDNITISLEVGTGSFLRTATPDKKFFIVLANGKTDNFSVDRSTNTISFTLKLQRVGISGNWEIGKATIFLKENVNGWFDKDICVGPSVTIIPGQLANISCTFSLPKNIKYSTSETTDISINTGGKNISFTTLLFDQNVPTQLTQLKYGYRRDSLENSLEPLALLRANQYVTFDQGSGKLIIKTGLPINDNGYTLLIEATPNDQRNLIYPCGISNKFTVTTDETSSDKGSSTSGGGAGQEFVERQNVLPPLGEPVSAAGRACDPGSGGTGTGGIETAIGCIPTEPKALVEATLRLTAGAGGGIALLLMVAGAFRMITSAGNPELIKKGGEQFTSAIIGLLFILFSVLLLKFIGVDILGLGTYLGY